MNISKKKLVNFFFLFGIIFFSSCNLSKAGEEKIKYVEEFITFTQLAGLPLRDLPKREAWRKTLPEVEEISIPRENGEPDQPALWYHSGTQKKKPLFLVLHSWSSDYLQHYGIPYGVFAEKNDWIFLHPNYRGSFDDKQSTASEKAVQDVLNALAYAKKHAPVDEDRIYLAGFSGGAMMSLIMAGRFPEKFTAVLAWVPVYDLNDWYKTVVKAKYNYTDKYKKDIEISCGGKPDVDQKAGRECGKRSPSSYLSGARKRKVKIFISGGIKDPFVPPSHAIRAFNDLAKKMDRIAVKDYRYLDDNETLPKNLKGQGKQKQFFEEAGLTVIFSRTSNNATIHLFDGGHNIIYNAGFQWVAEQQR